MYLKKFLNLKNKNILITGGMGNLGKSFISPLLELGSFIIICDKLPISKFNKYLKEIDNQYKNRIIYFQCDLSSNDKRKKFVTEFKNKISKLDVLINCASIVGTSKLTGWNTNFKNQSSTLWAKVFEINLISIFDIIKRLQDLLEKNRGGSIINISSIYASVAPDQQLYKGTNIHNPAAYSASKAGLNNLTKWLASTLAPKIRVNSISPGGILRQQPKNFIKKYVSKTPLNRMAIENDIIGSVIFLSTDMSKYITGQDIFVDGGFTIK